MNEPVGKSLWPALSSIHTMVFDFDGIFTDNAVYVDQNGVESVRCDRADGLGISILQKAIRLRQLSTRMFILSREANPVVLARAAKLHLECQHGVDSKKSFMDRYFARERPLDSQPYGGLVVLGNDLNDLQLIELAGFSVVPSDVHPLVGARAAVTLPQVGGHGFVRAFVERLLALDKMSRREIDELVHSC